MQNERTVIVPFGTFPHPLGEQVIDSDAVQRIVNRLNEWGRDIVVDYRHESMSECGTAEAAGWVKTKTVAITKEGISAVIEWTDDAENLIKAKKYRFLSPVFESQNGEITGLLNLGLTNNPNIHSMPPLINQLQTKEIYMEQKICKPVKEALGLDDSATSEEVLNLITSLGAKRNEAQSIAGLLGDAVAVLGLTPDSSDAVVRQKIVELSKTAVASRDETVDRLVNDAVSAGKLRPALKEWAKRLAVADPDSLRLYIANSGPQIPLGIAIDEKMGDAHEKQTESEKNVMRLLNINATDYKKYGN